MSATVLPVSPSGLPSRRAISDGARLFRSTTSLLRKLGAAGPDRRELMGRNCVCESHLVERRSAASATPQAGAKFAHPSPSTFAQECAKRCTVDIADFSRDGIDTETGAVQKRLRALNAQVLKVGQRGLTEHGFATA